MEVQLRRLDREEVRLVDAYQAEVIGLDELKERRQQIQDRRQVLIAHAAEQEKLARESPRRPRPSGRSWRAFCERIRSRLDQLAAHEKQRILQLLVERIIVGEDTLEIRHVIPLRALKSESPERCDTVRAIGEIGC